MSARRLVPLLALLILLPHVAGAQGDGVDVLITLHPGAEPTVSDGPGVFSLVENEEGERYAWEVEVGAEYTVVEFRVPGGLFDIERPRQVVPLLVIHPDEPTCKDPKTQGMCDYPLFENVFSDEIWDVDGPVRISNHRTSGDGIVIRVGIPGPVRATLALERDVVAPHVTPTPRQNLTHVGFYQETTTDELALVDLQVRKVGAPEWTQNPTTVYHVLQRFPIQGFDAETDYEQRFIVTDWAGNSRVSDIETFRTPAEPVRPLVTVTPLSPAPNGTLHPAEIVFISARIDSPDSPVEASGVRVFFDRREMPEGWTYSEGVVTFVPETVELGRHTVAIEATNVDGGMSRAVWTFHLGDEPSTQAATPGIGLAPLAAVALLAALALRRRS